MSIQQPRVIVRVATAVLIAAGGLVSSAGDSAAQAPAISPGQSEASAPAALPQPLTREALRDLLARLSDTQVRELLIAQLDREISEAPAADAMIGGMDQRARALRESWAAMFAAVRELPGVPRFFADQLIGDGSPVRLLWIAVGLVAIFAVGILAEQLYLLAVRDVRRQIYAAQPATAAARVGHSLLALLLDFIGIVVFALATTGAFFVLHQGHGWSRW